MTVQFAPWVEPIASKHREVRGEVLRLAQSISDADLARETDDRWTVRDEFAHIAASESNVVRILQAITNGETPDMSVFSDIDANNARQLDESRGRPWPAIIDDLGERGRQLQVMMARLRADAESAQPAGLPFPLAQLAAGYAMHEPYHLSQIRAAIGRDGATG